MLQSKIDEIENSICESLVDFWGSKIGTIVVLESTNIPYNILTIEFSLYNYCMVVIRLEHDSLGFSIKNNGGCFSLLPHRIDIKSLSTNLNDIDREVCLRIPDKYLKAKGWI